MKAKGMRVVGATLDLGLALRPSARTAPTRSTRARRATNDFIRSAGVFDAVADFDAATLDTARARSSRTCSPTAPSAAPGTSCIPNRAGYAAMARAIDLGLFAPTAVPPQAMAARRTKP
jgi:hypothetical protein